MKPRLLVALVVVTAVGLAACGRSTPSATERSSTPSSTNVPTTTTTLLPPYTPSTGPYAAVAGSWGGHGRGATIEATGTGTAIWRDYRSCSQYPQPCDGPGLPISYYAITFKLRSMSDETASGQITSSDAPLAPIGSVSVTLLGGDQMSLGTPEMMPPSQFPITFCGPTATVGACGF